MEPGLIIAAQCQPCILHARSDPWLPPVLRMIALTRYTGNSASGYHTCFIALANVCAGMVFRASSRVSQARRACSTP